VSAALRAAILAATHAVEAARVPLCALDAAAGDGDHGMTMAIGARAVRAGLESGTSVDPVAIVRQAALGMAAAGGTIGPIWMSGLLAVADVLDGARGPDGTVAASVATARSAADAAAAAVQRLGHASRGDKTILDALIPTCEALAAAEGADMAPAAAATGAAAAATAGAASTVAMVAAIGRAARLGERSRGTADPGATSFAIAISALAATLAPTGSEA